MLPVFEEDEKTLIDAMRLNGFNQKYSVKKKIKETGLYSIYLISANEQIMLNDEVLLIEHPPAKEPSAHILPINLTESGTATEIMKEIAEAVSAHFARNEYWFR
ncbi:hypothetical protein QOZ98_002323 [Planomicrobium stackebrandtii]|uniref:Uncharacterized protein n=1 Tax=Planomicrobium stackebrandtii TaxID=253160 RepID=A0ABU0GVV1_9BACL|nr:hypothetical protein [Planomicrobium stackebrandtii]MDQ0429495.1 hypothetical protein [Planomicrobium stackebrandtii]